MKTIVFTVVYTSCWSRGHDEIESEIKRHFKGQIQQILPSMEVQVTSGVSQQNFLNLLRGIFFAYQVYKNTFVGK